MKSDAFEQRYREMTRLAPEVFLRDGSHANILALEQANGETAIVALSWQHEREKAATGTLLHNKFGGASWYVFVSEGWLAVEDTSGLPPSQRPDREEVLTVVAVHRDGRRRAAYWRILREPTRLEGPETLYTPASWLDGAVLESSPGRFP